MSLTNAQYDEIMRGYQQRQLQNKHIARKKLTQEEIKREVIALQDMGHKRLAIEAGEDPVNNPIEYVLESIKTIYDIKHKKAVLKMSTAFFINYSFMDFYCQRHCPI